MDQEINTYLYTSVDIVIKKAPRLCCVRLVMSQNAYFLKHNGVPKGIRTPITAVKGRCPNH